MTCSGRVPVAGAAALTWPRRSPAPAGRRLDRRALLAASSFLLLLQAELVFGHGAYHERMTALTVAVEQNPSDPLLRFELANLHGQHGDLELALEDLDRVDALAPGKFLTDLLRGSAFLVASQFTKAKEAFDRQLVSHPENPRAWLFRARAERQLGHDDACLADYREAFKRTPSPDPDLVQEVADALALRHCQPEAAQVLAKGIEKLGKIPSLVLRAVDLDLTMKNFDAALHLVEEAQHDAPRPEPWMARRAAILDQAGRFDESHAAWKALVVHLASLPDQERSSHAMTTIADEARQALDKLKSPSAAELPSASSLSSSVKHW
jgi:tetratricopeptide (TPR) repeat protein